MTVNAKYSTYASKADTAIDTWGEDCTIVEKTDQFFDPETGKVLYDADVEHDCRAVITPIDIRRIATNTNILASDLSAKIAANSLSIVPTVGQKLQRGSVEYSIVSVRTIGPDEVPILYEAVLRLS